MGVIFSGCFASTFYFLSSFIYTFANLDNHLNRGCMVFGTKYTQLQLLNNNATGLPNPPRTHSVTNYGDDYQPFRSSPFFIESHRMFCYFLFTSITYSSSIQPIYALFYCLNINVFCCEYHHISDSKGNFVLRSSQKRYFYFQRVRER